VLDYMARVELEVDRNVLELIAMLPDPPKVDRTFHRDVWQPQEVRHGQILGALSHIEPVQDVVRMLCYLTGMTTERAAVLAYNRLSATGLHEQLSRWQRWLVRHMRRISFAPVGANNPRQKADFGDVVSALGLDGNLEAFARRIARVERELLWVRDQGMEIPDYVLRAGHDAVDLARTRAALPA